MSSLAPGAIVGRRRERAALARALAAASEGRSAALVVRGAAGTGKTALVDDVLADAADVRVLRTRAVEAESDLPFAALHDLLRPVSNHLDALPEPQAAALAGALALGPPDAGDRFTVYAATLGLLAALAEERPLAVVVDDGQWLDVASAEALAFAGRRLDADGVALLVVARELPPAVGAAGFEELELTGLEHADLCALLAASHPELGADLTARIATAAAGLPRAAQEIAAALPPDVRRGETPAPDPLPGSTSLEQTVVDRAAAMGEAARTALLAAALSEDGDLGVLAAALRALDVSPEALAEPEAAGLVVLDGGRCTFPQPSVRAAVVRAAAPDVRRSLHRTLAGALSAEADADRRAWHLAAACIAPDEDVAAALEATARHAAERHGHAAAERAYTRAAELSTDPEVRGRRLVAAAREAALAGRPAAALGALDGAYAATTLDERRSEVRRLRGRIAARGGSADEAVALLEAEGERVAAADPTTAGELLAEAVFPCLRAGRPRVALALARRAAELAGDDGAPAVLAQSALAAALLFTGEVDEGVARARSAAALADAVAPEAPVRLQVAAALRFAGEHDDARRALQDLVDAARRASAPGLLPYALGRLGGLELETGRFRAAATLLHEGERLGRETGQLADLAVALGARAWLDAVQGRDDDSRAAAAEVLAMARELGPGSALDHAACAQALLELGRGRPASAASALEEVVERATRDGWCDAAVPPHPAAELAEALARSGEAARAEDVLQPFAADAERTGRPLARALALRVAGVLAPADAIDAPFAAALQAHEGHPSPFERARTSLAYGERLRRSGRRADSRPHLRSAVAAFTELGATPWLERAAEELRATGETVHRREPDAIDRLTPHELQVALVVAAGASNRDAAARLFLSPKTIEFHLSRVFRKLNVRSRTELARALADQQVA